MQRRFSNLPNRSIFINAIRRADALLQVPNYCGDHHLTRFEGTLVTRLLPIRWRVWFRPRAAWTGSYQTHHPILLTLCSLSPLWLILRKASKSPTSERTESHFISMAFA